MRYLRDVKGISIGDSPQKQALRNMGYYHGYKGYRFYGSVRNTLPYTDFTQLKAVYDFDMLMKTLLYPWVMFLETALKNHTLEIVLENAQSEGFEDVCKRVLSNDDPKMLLTFYQSMYDALNRDYKKRPVVTHFYDKNKPVPIWAVFEIISMGNFGAFLGCLETAYREDLSSSIGLPRITNQDRDCRLPQHLVLALRGLRNAIAHNGPIYDVRFNLNNKHNSRQRQNRNVNPLVGDYMELETEIAPWHWDSIADYVLLIAQLLTHFGVKRKEITDFLGSFLEHCDAFGNSVAPHIAGLVVPQKGLDRIRQFKTTKIFPKNS